jgi:hypothetical protein
LQLQAPAVPATGNGGVVHFQPDVAVAGVGAAGRVPAAASSMPPAVLPAPAAPPAAAAAVDARPAGRAGRTSKYKGVCWNKKNQRWQTAINAQGK